jgi:cardiolipin synthase
MGNLLGPPLLKGNKVTALENGDQIFPALLEAIRSAQRTITFENFLFKEGRYQMRLLKLCCFLFVCELALI